MKIVKYPDNILLTPCVEVEVTKEVSQIAEEMFNFMSKLHWGKPVGLAAPQVGHNIRLFWALDNLYINPKIIERSKHMTICEEGCYSLEENKFDYTVSRHSEITLEWRDKKNKLHCSKFKDFKAQVIQHEYDHIEGRMCNDQN
jgi:peptide deformylase